MIGNKAQDAMVQDHIEGCIRKYTPTQFAIDECGECGIELYPQDNIHEHLRSEKLGNKYYKVTHTYCDECTPKCALEADCGQPMHPGGEGGCQMHEIASWLDTLRETSDPLKRMEIVNALMDLGWEAKVKA